jgi:hypothetical protein
MTRSKLVTILGINEQVWLGANSWRYWKLAVFLDFTGNTRNRTCAQKKKRIQSLYWPSQPITIVWWAWITFLQAHAWCSRRFVYWETLYCVKETGFVLQVPSSFVCWWVRISFLWLYRHYEKPSVFGQYFCRIRVMIAVRRHMRLIQDAEHNAAWMHQSEPRNTRSSTSCSRRCSEWTISFWKVKRFDIVHHLLDTKPPVPPFRSVPDSLSI